eukprot:6211360-Pleurochrysis_carterae.AAC.2
MHAQRSAEVTVTVTLALRFSSRARPSTSCNQSQRTFNVKAQIPRALQLWVCDVRNTLTKFAAIEKSRLALILEPRKISDVWVLNCNWGPAKSAGRVRSRLPRAPAAPRFCPCALAALSRGRRGCCTQSLDGLSNPRSLMCTFNSYGKHMLRYLNLGQTAHKGAHALSQRLSRAVLWTHSK